MILQRAGKKTYELTDNAQILGELRFISWFSYKADALLGNEIYQITPKGIFSDTILVSIYERGVARMKTSWNGSISILFQDGREYLLKNTSRYRVKYVLEDHLQQNLIILKPEFNWGKLNYSYQLEFPVNPQDKLLVLIASYAVICNMASRAAAMG